MRLIFFAKLSIAEQLGEEYNIYIRRQNKEATDYPHILSRIFCGDFAESESLKRIKTFLRNTMTQEWLNALTILTMTEMTDFN